MKLSRTGKLIRNSVFLMLVLVFLWFYFQQPLPLCLDYERTERAYFLEDTEVVAVLDDLDCMISRDREHTYLFERDSGRAIRTFPAEDGMGWVFYTVLSTGEDVREENPLYLFAWEESGQAQRMKAELTTWGISETGEPVHSTYAVQSEKEDGLFRAAIWDTEETGYWSVYGSERPNALQSVYQHTVGNGARIMDGGYALTMTFYDAAGNVVAEQEWEESFDEN